jgi:hypothetical protein
MIKWIFEKKFGLMDFIFFKFTFGASLLYLVMIKWMFKKKWIDVMRLPYLLLFFFGCHGNIDLINFFLSSFFLQNLANKRPYLQFLQVVVASALYWNMINGCFNKNGSMSYCLLWGPKYPYNFFLQN